MSEQDATLDEFVDSDGGDSDSDTLEQEQFGPFTLSTPGEWTAKRLGDIKQLITRGKQPTYAEDGVPVINQECIYWEGWHFENLRYLEQEVAEEWKEKYFPQKGDVILNSTGQGTLGRAQVYPDDEQRAIDSHVTLLRTNKELNPYFHRYFLESHLGQALLYSMCVNGSTGQIELSKTRLDLLPTPLPPVEEQHKIASILHNIDQAIQKTESLLDRYDRLQTGLLRKHFGKSSVQVNYSDDRVTKRLGPKSYTVPKDWNIVQISDIGEVVTGDTPSTKNEDYYGGELPFVTPKDFGEGRRVFEGSRQLTDEGRQKSRPVPKDSVMMDCIGMDMGKIRIAGRELATNQQINSVIVDSEEILPEFLYYHLKAISNLIQSQAGQTRTPIVSKSQFSSFEVFKPPLSAQREVVDSLSVFDELVEKESNYTTQLRRLKQGLMQDLLSGTVRTTDTNIEVLNEVAQHG